MSARSAEAASRRARSRSSLVMTLDSLRIADAHPIVKRCRLAEAMAAKRLGATREKPVLVGKDVRLAQHAHRKGGIAEQHLHVRPAQGERHGERAVERARREMTARAGGHENALLCDCGGRFRPQPLPRHDLRPIRQAAPQPLSEQPGSGWHKGRTISDEVAQAVLDHGRRATRTQLLAGERVRNGAADRLGERQPSGRSGSRNLAHAGWRRCLGHSLFGRIGQHLIEAQGLRRKVVRNPLAGMAVTVDRIARVFPACHLSRDCAQRWLQWS